MLIYIGVYGGLMKEEERYDIVNEINLIKKMEKHLIITEQGIQDM